MTPDVSIKLSCTEPIPGLFVFENVLSKEEEAQMIHLLDVGDVVPWKLSRFNGLGFGKRWGVHCNLRDRRVDAPQHPLPPLLQQFITTKLPLIRQTLQQKGNTLHAFSPNEANAIDYRRQEGHWLKAHVDDRQLSKEPILNLSLVGDCIMTFQNQKKSKVGFQPQQPEEARVLLKPGTLQVLTGKARYDYSHAIAHADLLSDRRISITMRESPLTASNSFAKGGTGVVPSSTAKPILHFAWRKHHPKTQSQSKNQTLAAIKMNP
jgi:alkylated DNA repair protein alkB family protein 4